VVSFTPRPFYTGGKSSFYPLGGRLGGPQYRSDSGGEVKTHLCPCGEPNRSGPDRSLVSMLTELHRLPLFHLLAQYIWTCVSTIQELP